MTLLVLLLTCAGSGPGWAQDSLTLSTLPTDPFKAAERQNATRKTLAEHRLSIEQLRREIARINAEQPVKMQALSGETVSAAMVEQARLDSDAVRLKQEELETGIDGAKRQIKGLQQAIPALEAQEQLLKNPAKDGPEIGNRSEQLAQLRVALEQRRTDLQLEQDNLKNLEEWLALVEQRRTLAGQWRARLEEIHLQQQAQGRLDAQQDLAVRLEREQQAQLGKAEELRARLQQQGEKLSVAQRALLEAEIQAAEERAKLLRWDIRLAAIEDELANWEGLADAKDADLHRIQEGVRQLTVLRSELRETGDLLERRLELLVQQQALPVSEDPGSANDPSLRERAHGTFALLERDVRQRLDTLREQRDRLERLREHLETVRFRRSGACESCPCHRPTARRRWLFQL